MTTKTPALETAKRILVVLASLPVALGLWYLSFFMLPAGTLLLLLSVVPPALVIWIVWRSQFGKGETVARDTGSRLSALAMISAPVLGFGTWIALQVFGIGLGIVPFLMPPQVPHPLVEEWDMGFKLAGLVSVPIWWWLLSRRTRGPGSPVSR